MPSTRKVPGFRRTKITIDVAAWVHPSCKQAIAAWVRGGLAVHANLGVTKLFNVTHINSGRKIINAVDKATAFRAARVLERMCDWRKVKRRDDGFVVGASKRAFSRARAYRDQLEAS
jgi:hypothetical protein